MRKLLTLLVTLVAIATGSTLKAQTDDAVRHMTTSINAKALADKNVQKQQPYKLKHLVKRTHRTQVSNPGQPALSRKVVRAQVPGSGEATIVLNIPDDIWQDGSGYQMLLDADANTFGSVFPESGPLTTSGDAPAGTYDEFEYKIPTGADGALNTSNIIITGQASINIPAGTYDWCITNPTPGDRLWIASQNGSIGGRYDDYVFEEGKTYIFTVTLGDNGNGNDQTDLEIIETSAPTTTYTLAGVSITGTGLKSNDSGYFPDGFRDGLELTFNGDSNPPSGSVDMNVFGLHIGNMYGEVLKTEPQEGETYYAGLDLFRSSTCPSNVEIDFSEVTPADVSITIPGYDVTVTDINSMTMNGSPGITIEYSVTKQAAVPVSDFIDFETGDLSQFPFKNDATYPWKVVIGNGGYCMTSGNQGVSSSTSAISATYTFTSDGYISFDAECMGEGTGTFWDACIFYINGEQVFKHGADVSGWHTYTFEVPAGENTFTWSYSKDSSVNPTGDYFSVDNIKFAPGGCIAASNVEARQVGKTINVSWEGISDSFTLRYRPTEGGSWTTVSDITATSYTITGLDGGTYEIQVQASCETGTWASATVTFEAINSQGPWYGYAEYSFDSASWQDKFIGFTADDPATVTAISKDMASWKPFAGTYADGYVWFIGSGEGSNNHSLGRAQFDAATQTLGDVETVASGFEESGSVATSMAYNPADGKIYYISNNSSNFYLRCFDPANPTTPETKGALGFQALTLAINSAGEAYCMPVDDTNAKLYRVNLDDASTTEVGSTGVPLRFVQSMAFDPDTGELFWAQVNEESDDGNGLYKVNTETGKATFVGHIGSGTEVTCLFKGPAAVPVSLPELTFTPWPDFELTYGNTEGDVAGQKSALLSGMPELGENEYEYAALSITNTNLVNVDDPNDILVMALQGPWDPSDNLKYYSPLMVDGQEIEYTETSGYGNEGIQTLAGQTLEYLYIDNYGTAEDFEKVKGALTGKVAVCNRGNISFYIKANAAMANGAIGLIVVNNVEGTVNMSLTGYEYTNPAIAVRQEAGALLKSNAEYVTDGEAPYYVGTLEMGEVVAGHNELGLGFGKDYYSGSFTDYEVKAWVPDWTNATPGATYKATITYPRCNYYIWNTVINDYFLYPIEIGTQSTTVTVTIPITIQELTLSFSETEVEATFGEAFEAPELIFSPDEDAAHKAVLTYGTWTSSDESVATVDEDGNVTLVASGTTTITISFPGDDDFTEAEASYTLTVNKGTAVLEFSETSVTANVGMPFTAPELTTTPEGLTVTYSSSDESVATVDAETGEVTAVGKGTATITATFEGNGQYEAAEASYTVTTSTGVPINADNFPDEAFRNYLLSQDYGQDGFLTDEEIEALTELDMPGLGIKDLTGMQLFTNLTYLDCSDNELTKLDVTPFEKLEYLDCGYNELTKVDVSQNQNLTVLSVTENPLEGLKDLPESLQELYCVSCGLTELDVTGLKDLRKLYCRDNELTELDVTQNEHLTDLWADENHLLTLDLTKNESLSVIRVEKQTATLPCERIGQTEYAISVPEGFDASLVKNFMVDGVPAEFELRDGKLVFTSETQPKTVTYDYNTQYMKEEMDVKVTITLKPTEPVSAGLSFDVAEAEATLGEDFTAPELQNPNGVTVTWSSSDESVATVDAETGEVTLVGPGTTVITATFAGTDFYKPATVSYTLTVKEPVITGINGLLSPVAPEDVYDLGGRKVKNAGESLETLKKGVYIIGGKKVTWKR